MKSIRLSLMVYFLALLVVALGAAAVLVNQSAHQTLLAKQKATEELLEQQYKERCSQKEAQLDEALLTQARTLVRLLDFQWTGDRRFRTLSAAEMLATGAFPTGPIQEAFWATKGRWLPPMDLFRNGPQTEIRFDAEALVHQVDSQVAEYFQIDSAWISPYRSPSLMAANRALPFDPAVFTLDQDVLAWEFDDVDLGPDLTVRRVMLKAPAPRFFHRTPSPMPARGGTKPGSGSAPDKVPDKARPSEQPQRPAILIQCACDVSPHRAILAGFQADRDGELARLQEETDASLASLRSQLLLIGLATFAATAVGGMLLVRFGLTPLHRLSEAVSRVSEKDFRLQFDEPKLPSELRPIVERLNVTLDQLKRAFAREKQAAADISHELRTPLAALLTTTDVALRKQRTPEEYREMLADCRASGQQMSRLVERLLALARLDAGVDTLKLKAVDVACLAEQCAALVRPLAEARGLSLNVQHDGPASLPADPDKLREVLTNLLHNAIQYNRPNGVVGVSVARDNGHLRLEVSDTGIGIAPEAQAHIFERFYRADPSRQNDGLNAGLGLAIVKGYVDLMGGTIAVDSTLGQGSTFRVELPAK